MARLPFTPTHSSLDKFESCPRAYQATYITKEIQWKDSEASCLGQVIHKLAEWYIDWRTTNDCPVLEDITQPALTELTYKSVLAATRVSLPPSFDDARKHWSNILAVLERVPFVLNAAVASEVKLCVGNDLTAVDWTSKDGFFRAIVDVLILVGDKIILLDWKSSKEMRETKQLKRSAMVALLTFPKAAECTTVYVSSRGQPSITSTYTRADVLDIINEVKHTSGRLAESYELNLWTPIKSGLCKAWCDVHACKHNGRTKAQVDAGYRG